MPTDREKYISEQGQEITQDHIDKSLLDDETIEEKHIELEKRLKDVFQKDTSHTKKLAENQP